MPQKMSQQYREWRERAAMHDSEIVGKARQMGDFIRALYGPYERGWIEMRGLSPVVRGPHPRIGATLNRQHTVYTWRKFYPLAETCFDPTDQFTGDALSLEYDGFDVYVGVLPRAKPGQAKKDFIYEAGAAWAELDFDKQEGGEAGVVDRVAAADPDIIVRSGGGLHIYWTFCQPLALTVEGQKKFERALRVRQAELRTDPVHDVTRILRLPGTSNLKQTEPRKVELLKCQ